MSNLLNVIVFTYLKHCFQINNLNMHTNITSAHRIIAFRGMHYICTKETVKKYKSTFQFTKKETQLCIIKLWPSTVF